MCIRDSINYVSREPPFSTRLLRDLMRRSPMRADPVYSVMLDSLAAILKPLEGLMEPHTEVVCTDCLVSVP